ncbi:MAG: YceI family protein, partial [Candidatus Heimdallarchaeota archaeon]|nr:YceI family protein [Candidatus Heimdallarchaeota archaeon]
AINWSSAYNGSGADLTGKFQYFSLKEFSFDETNPANISFEANVLLNSVTTGQPLRDEGCLLTTYETDATKSFEAENLAVIKTNGAKYNTEDDGYTIDAELTFLGSAHPVTINLYYLGQSTFTGYKMASFEAELTFNAISDFGLNSTSVEDAISVNIEINLKNNN